jgi:hypothetical protein
MGNPADSGCGMLYVYGLMCLDSRDLRLKKVRLTIIEHGDLGLNPFLLGVGSRH